MIVTGLLVAVYAGLVLLTTQVFRVHTPVAVAASTLAAAALFNPLRRRVQRAVDRRFNRARHNADQTVAAFATRLKDAVDLDSVRYDLASVVQQALEPAGVKPRAWRRISRSVDRLSRVAETVIQPPARQIGRCARRRGVATLDPSELRAEGARTMQTAVRDYPQGDLRISDADRDRSLSELSEAFQAGRITADELDQRSGQVLRSRTGSELTAVLADLPRDRPPAARAPGLRLPDVARIAVGAPAAAGATALSALAVANALPSGGTGPSGAEIDLKRQLAQEILAREGLKVQIPRGLIANPPIAGFDWVGTVIPAAFAVLLVVLIVFLYKTRAARP